MSVPATPRRRPHRVVTTAGHVDHGKSTLLRALTGMEPDRLDEERRRGLSIELGFVWGTLPGTSAAPDPVEVAFVDVPGHERFIATMLAGVGPAPATVLVVAADDGWSAQTAEHAEVLALLGIPVVATAITKSRTVDPARVGEVTDEITRELAGLGLSGGDLVVTDAVAGVGVDDLRRTLRDALARIPVPIDVGRPRLWVDRRFSVTGSGTVVTGTLTGGRLAVGDRPRLLPTGEVGRVRGLASLGSDVDRAAPGERVAVNLSGIARTAIERGDALVVGPAWQTSEVADGWLRVLPGHEIGSRGAWHVHVGSARTAARLRPLVGPVGTRDGTTSGEGAVRVVLDRALPLVTGDVLIVRDAGRRRTVGRIWIVDPLPVGRVPRGRAARAARAQTVYAVAAAETRAAALDGLLALADGVRRTEDVTAATGWRVEDGLAEHVVQLGAHLVTETRLAAWAGALAHLGAGSHTRGAVLPLLRDAGVPDDLADGLLAHLVAEGNLVAVDTGFALPQFVDHETSRREARRQAVVDALAAEPFSPPALEDVAREHGADGRDIAALVQSGEVVRIGKVAFAGRAVATAVEQLRRSPLADAPFTAGEARAVLPTSRKFLIPLLEHLARTGVTAFDGSHHRVRGRDIP